MEYSEKLWKKIQILCRKIVSDRLLYTICIRIKIKVYSIHAVYNHECSKYVNGFLIVFYWNDR